MLLEPIVGWDSVVKGGGWVGVYPTPHQQRGGGGEYRIGCPVKKRGEERERRDLLQGIWGAVVGYRVPPGHGVKGGKDNESRGGGG